MGTFETIEADGRTARLYTAGDPSNGNGVVALHAWWGLNGDILAYADRLAEAGFAVEAPDLFDGAVAETIAEAEALSSGADEAACSAVVLAAIDRLAERVGGEERVAVIGFSFGAAFAAWAPAQRPGLRGTVVYYGAWTGDHLAEGRGPVLGHFAEMDPYESDESVTEFGAGAVRRRARDRHPSLSGDRALVCRAVEGRLRRPGRRAGVRAHGRVPARPPRGGRGLTAPAASPPTVDQPGRRRRTAMAAIPRNTRLAPASAATSRAWTNARRSAGTTYETKV